MVQMNNSTKVWMRRRNVFLVVLACGTVALLYAVAVPPSGIEYNLAGYITIRHGFCEKISITLNVNLIPTILFGHPRA